MRTVHWSLVTGHWSLVTGHESFLSVAARQLVVLAPHACADEVMLDEKAVVARGVRNDDGPPRGVGTKDECRIEPRRFLAPRIEPCLLRALQKVLVERGGVDTGLLPAHLGATGEQEQQGCRG